MKTLNLGCEKDYKEGWVNLDYDARHKADVHWDLNKFPYPFKDNTFDEILASFILEHITETRRAIMELYRIAKDKCLIYIAIPYHSSQIYWAELEHQRKFSWFTFGEWWCNSEFYWMFEIVKKKIVYTRINFKFMNYIMNPIINLFPRVYERLFSYIIPASDMVVILKVHKDKEFIEEKKEFVEKMLEKKYDNLKFIKEI